MKLAGKMRLRQGNQNIINTLEKAGYVVIEDKIKNGKSSYWIAKGSSVMNKEDNIPDTFTTGEIAMPGKKKFPSKEVPMM